MNNAADGGGGGALELIVDHATLDGVAAELAGAGSGFDECGSSVPATGGTGEAAELLCAILGAASQAGGRIAFEAVTLSAVVSECNAVAASADRSAAESYLVGG